MRTSLVALCLLAAPPALAQEGTWCNGTEGVADVARCNQAVHDRCRPRFAPNCVKGEIAQWRSAKPAAPAVDKSACKSPEFLAECKKAKDFYKECIDQIQIVPGTPDNHDAFRARARRADEARKFHEEFFARYPMCQDGWGECQSCKQETDTCLAFPDKMRQAWRTYHGILSGDRMREMRENVATLEKNPLDLFASQVFQRGAALFDEALAFAAVPVLQVDAKEIEGWKAWLATEKTKWMAAREKALDNVRCPTAKATNPGLSSALRQVFVAHLARIKKPDSTMKETVVQFGVTGPARQGRDAFTRITWEDVPAFACNRQEKPEMTTCRIFDVTLRRTKPDGGKWGAWEHYSIGGGGEMACKNLK